MSSSIYPCIAKTEGWHGRLARPCCSGQGRTSRPWHPRIGYADVNRGSDFSICGMRLRRRRSRMTSWGNSAVGARPSPLFLRSLAALCKRAPSADKANVAGQSITNGDGGTCDRNRSAASRRVGKEAGQGRPGRTMDSPPRPPIFTDEGAPCQCPTECGQTRSRPWGLFS